MKEEFLQYVWGQRLYKSAMQTTTQGVAIEVVNPGRLNADSGPDFFNAQIRVGGMTWAGNIEIHLTSDDWYRHGHDKDAAYDNVVLHVVGRSTGREIFTSKGELIPEVVLDYDEVLLSRYEDLMERGGVGFVRCADVVGDVPEVEKRAWLDALLVERLAVKSGRALELLDLYGGDVDQVFFCLLARALGGKVNGEPMEALARRTPLKVLLKHSSELQTEAVLLGQAGLLSIAKSEDEYVAKLQREYDFLSIKFGLEAMDGCVWKYARLRPQNFPDVRIVQLAAVVRAMRGNFGGYLGMALDKILAVGPSEYWDAHYRLGLKSGLLRRKALGSAMRRLIVVNCIVPFAVAESERYGDEKKKAMAVDMLRGMDIEQNSVLDGWKNVGIVGEDECDAQALIFLKGKYCDGGECLRCRFGHWAVGRGMAPIGFRRFV